MTEQPNTQVANEPVLVTNQGDALVYRLLYSATHRYSKDGRQAFPGIRCPRHEWHNLEELVWTDGWNGGDWTPLRLAQYGGQPSLPGDEPLDFTGAPRRYSCDTYECFKEAPAVEVLAALPTILRPDELNEEQPQRPWLIPGVMCEQGRIVLVGFEGDGKSTLLRQVAVAGASGVHPFTGESVEPVKVLLVDLENHPGDVRASIRRMLEGRDRPSTLALRLVPEGIDLLEERRSIHKLLQMEQPALVVIGPIYKMLPPSEGDESSVVKQMTDLMSQWSAEFGVAWLIEAHAPMAQAGGPRPLRPAGSRLWLHWPEVGISLRGGGQIQQFRNPRWAHEWPARLARGGHPYPWAVVTGDAKHAKQEELRAAVLASLSAGEEISKRTLRDRAPGDNTTISKVIDQLVEEGALRRRVEGQTHFISIP
ncbi:MAG TPA: AAA family ATPase [Acidimicrobiales bacterium]|nr:AAA family ATPase [Acidimicrobiales bacterium]